MRQLKVRLEQIDHQIQESRRNNAGQSELFLVINRLEEFASAVHDRLDTIDFVMKREVILGLVKRVEIHKEEILVVFRVDPDPGFNADENSANSDVGEKSMQDRTRRSFAGGGQHDAGWSRSDACGEIPESKADRSENEYGALCGRLYHHRQFERMAGTGGQVCSG
jgi:site-specific DNA recombinase